MKLHLPDFIIAGAARSGTTWLYCLLEQHPEIYMAKPVRPEPKFFLVDEIYQQGIAYYAHTWFSTVGGKAKVVGEKSTNYLENANVAKRIYQHLPQMKLIFILREPVQRAFSNYLWSRMNGLEDKDFETALSLEAERERNLPEKLRYARPHAYFSRGLYAQMLRPYFELFSKEQILCLRYEDIIDKPEVLAKQIHLFLDIQPRPMDAEQLGIINCADRHNETILESTLRLLLERYAEPNCQLVQLLGSDFKIWENG